MHAPCRRFLPRNTSAYYALSERTLRGALTAPNLLHQLWLNVGTGDQYYRVECLQVMPPIPVRSKIFIYPGWVTLLLLNFGKTFSFLDLSWAQNQTNILNMDPFYRRIFRKFIYVSDKGLISQKCFQSK